MIPYGKQTIDEQDINEVVKVLKSDFLTQGPKIEEFEKKFSEYVNVKYAVAVSNGTTALHIASLVAGLKNGTNMITTPMTFAASSNCGLYCGASVKFADITKNGLINPQNIEKLIDKNTKVIIPVDYAGHPVELQTIKEIADKHQIKIIEDGCHALGAKYKRTKIGDCKFADMTIFSFHPAKHITTGEGGMVTTNSEEIYEKLKLYRSHGITKDPNKLQKKNEGPWYHEMQILGMNYRITDIQCALGISQLTKLDKFVAKRRSIAKIYNDAFINNPNLDFIHENNDCECSYHLYPIILNEKLIQKKKEIFNKLRDQQLGVQVHYIPVYFHPYYQEIGFKEGLCPNAELFYKQEISIPMFPSLKDDEIDYVIRTLKNLF